MSRLTAPVRPVEDEAARRAERRMRGQFYPSRLPTNAWFPHYAKRFQTVELNAPFYSWPTIATVDAWSRQAGRRKFVYTSKPPS